MSNLRERLAAAENDLRKRLREIDGQLPSALLVSRFGFEFLALGTELCRWPAATLAGLSLSRGPGTGIFSARRWQGQTLLLCEWEFDPQAAPTAAEEALPVWLAARLGIPTVYHLAAGAALVEDLDPPTAVLVSDQIRWGPADPMRGWPAAREGARFPQLQPLVSAERLRRAQSCMTTAGLDAEPRVAMIRQGPSGPTRAECQAFQRLGAEVLLEAGSAEAMAARQAGLGFLAMVLLLDQACEPASDPGELAARAQEVLPRIANAWEALLAGERPSGTGSKEEEEAA